MIWEVEKKLEVIVNIKSPNYKMFSCFVLDCSFFYTYYIYIFVDRNNKCIIYAFANNVKGWPTASFGITSSCLCQYYS